MYHNKLQIGMTVQVYMHIMHEQFLLDMKNRKKNFIYKAVLMSEYM